MIAFLPFIAAIISAGNTLFEKTIFDRKRKRYKLYVPFLFLFSFIILIVFLYPFLGRIEPEAFIPLFLFLLLSTVFLAAVGNLLYYRGFQSEGLSEIQPFVVSSPLLTIVIASIIYPDERNWKVLILALIAATALIVSHIEKQHIKFNKGILFIMSAVFVGAIETNIVKELLYFYSPVALYTVRTGFVALILFIIIKPLSFYDSRNSFLSMVGDFVLRRKKNGVIMKIWKETNKLILVSAMWVSIMILVYYGYQAMGVVYTVLIMMMVPVLVVFGSRFILKEKRLRKRDVVALVIVLTCVVLAQIIR